MAATIKDVAKKTGLSIATISKYINGGHVLDSNRDLIDQAIRTLGFRVNEIARGLKTSKTMTIGVLIPDLKNIFFTTIVTNIEGILIQNGYSTIICDYRQSPELERMKLEFLANKLVDGIVAVPDSCGTRDILGLAEKNISVVLIDRIVEGVSCDAVLVDNLNAAYHAVEQLIVRGHRRIGIICGPGNIITARERLKGYLRVCEDHAVDIDENLIKQGDYDVESGYRLLHELLDAAWPPSAVFVTNYEMTLGAIMAINEKNIKIPDGLSFIGFDNLQMSKIVKPALSVVVQPMDQIGETAANLLLKRLKGDKSDFPSLICLKTRLIMKDSVKNCREQA